MRDGAAPRAYLTPLQGGVISKVAIRVPIGGGRDVCYRSRAVSVAPWLASAELRKAAHFEAESPFVTERKLSEASFNISLMEALEGMEETQYRERFDTGVKKIRHEIRSLLAQHGLFGTITDAASGLANSVPESSNVEIQVKGVTTGRQFDRRQIEDCYLRVGGNVLASIVAMVKEVAPPGPPESTHDPD